MRYETTTVRSTADIREAHSEIDGPSVATIRAILMEREVNGNEAVAWVAEWLTEEKPLEYEAGQVAVGVIERESDKAWQFGQAGTDHDPVWLPKSQAAMFTLESGVDEIDSEQRTLGDV